jgi:hypothetical protein
VDRSTVSPNSIEIRPDVRGQVSSSRGGHLLGAGDETNLAYIVRTGRTRAGHVGCPTPTINLQVRSSPASLQSTFYYEGKGTRRREVAEVTTTDGTKMSTRIGARASPSCLVTGGRCHPTIGTLKCCSSCTTAIG